MREYGKISITSQNMDAILFTADPHYFHENIINLCGRPFADGNHMRETLIRNWNAVVLPHYQVFVLGDMFWKRGDEEQCKAVMQRLNGRKWLVAGNHDLYPKDFYLDIGFEDAWDYLEIRGMKELIICSHYPILEWNGFFRGSWHLHGHVHGRGSHFSARALDVGVDCNNFTPVSWREVSRKLSGGMEIDQKNLENKCRRKL